MFFITKKDLLKSIFPKRVIKWKIKELQEKHSKDNSIQKILVFENNWTKVFAEILFKNNNTFKNELALFIEGFDYLFFDNPSDLSSTMTKQFTEFYNKLHKKYTLKENKIDDKPLSFREQQKQKLADAFANMEQAFLKSKVESNLEEIETDALFMDNEDKKINGKELCFDKEMLKTLNYWITNITRYNEVQIEDIKLLKKYADMNIEKNDFVIKKFYNLENELDLIKDPLFDIVWKKELYRTNSSLEDNIYMFTVKTNIINKSQLFNTIKEKIMKWTWWNFQIESVEEQNNNKILKIKVTEYATD